jgi:hypothetical protein
MRNETTPADKLRKSEAVFPMDLVTVFKDLRTSNVEVRQLPKDSVTQKTCPCGKPAKKKFCCSACRQAAYRTSPAHVDNLKRLRNARAARKADHYRRKHQYQAISTVRGYGGPIPSGVPRIGDLNLNNYTKETMRTEAIQPAS